ncbi:hypothetical protein [Desulfovibrio sp. SGI.169]|uniref:hypothetical protein n=1 Tax=Desulfovibrio sp. SGI.169 TaxID=3420561 RepID=UPI003D093EF5
MFISAASSLSAGFFTEPARRDPGASTKAEAGRGDQVSFSREALALAKRALCQRQTAGRGLAVQDRQDQADAAADSADKRQELFQRFRSHAHRGGIRFPGMSAAETEGSSQAEAASELRRDGETHKKTARKTSDIERQIKELTGQLEQVLASDMPDIAKEEMASGIKRKMDELLGQAQALKTGEEAGQTAQADAPAP